MPISALILIHNYWFREYIVYNLYLINKNIFYLNFVSSHFFYLHVHINYIYLYVINYYNNKIKFLVR